jgi:hypothetical protein
MLVAL